LIIEVVISLFREAGIFDINPVTMKKLVVAYREGKWLIPCLTPV
jgi:hypothetical protein